MTKPERKWMDSITQLGCIVCLLTGRGFVPGAVHHILVGGRRVGHSHTICLCDPGHHKGAARDSGEISRHPNRRAFEARYGTEASLLAETRCRVEAARMVA